MDNESGVCSLVTLILMEKTPKPSDVDTYSSFIPPCLLMSDFVQSLQDVMTVRRTLLDYRWRKYFDICSCELLDSPDTYVRCIIYACLKEHECHQNVFDSFISVCVLVKYFSDETLQKMGKDYTILNHFLIMEFYKLNLRKTFYRRGGFQRLVEYIRSHRYLRWKLPGEDLVLPDDTIASFDDLHLVFAEKFHKELKREGISQVVIDLDEVVNDARSHFIAQTWLQTTVGNQLSTILSEQDQVQMQFEYREKERAEAAAKIEALEEAFRGFSCFNSDSETSSSPRQEDCKVRYEKIIQAVIKYNHSKSSAKENASDRFQEEAGGILERLKDTIKSLDEVLDSYDEE